MKKSLIIIFLFFFSFLIVSCDMPQSPIVMVNITVENGNGSGTYKQNDMVEISSDSDAFLYWEKDGEMVSTDNPYIFLATKDATYQAIEKQEENDNKNYEKTFLKEVKRTDKFVAYSSPNTAQIRREDALPTEIDSTLRFSAAANEKETGLFNIQALVDVSVELENIIFTDFYKNDKTVISKNNIESYVELYQEVTSNWSELYNQRKSEYPNGVDETPLGTYADPLLPLSAALVTNYKNITLKKGENQGFFFILNIPKNQEKGTYHGQVQLLFKNETKLVLPVEITVFGFNLPDENHAKTIINIVTSEMAALYDVSDNTSVYYAKAWEMMTSHGVSGFTQGTCWGSNTIDEYIRYLKEAAANNRIAVYELTAEYDSGIHIDYTYTEKNIISYTKKGSLDNLLILRAETIHEANGLDIYGYKDIFRILVENSTNELDLLKKAVIYFPQADEPSDIAGYIQNILCENVINSCRDYCLENCDFTGKEQVKESLKNIQYLMTCEPNDTVLNGLKDFKITGFSGSNNCLLNNVKYKNVTGYIPLFTYFMKDSKVANNITKIMNDDAYCTWWYGCIMPVNPYQSLLLNTNRVIIRANRIQEFALGIEGQLYYCCNRTQEYYGGVSYKKTEEEILSGVRYEDAFNDGLLIYPVYNVLKSYNRVTRNPIYYLSSIRLETIAESIDDYNYLYYAFELVEKLPHALQENYQKMLSEAMNSVYDSPATNTKDSDVLFAARLKVAQIIENILKIM